jgi:hypothetical protein
MPRIYTDQQRKGCIKLVAAGTSLERVSKITGVPKTTVWKIAKDAGIRSEWHDEWSAKREQALSMSGTSGEVAKAVGASPSAVEKWRKFERSRQWLIEAVAQQTGYPAAGVRSILDKAELAGFKLVQRGS